MTYASTIWWRKKEIHAKALRRVQNRALRIICAAFRTTPTQALEVEAAIPPIHLHLDYLERKAGIHLNRLSITNVRVTGAPDSRRILSNITVCSYDITHLQENPQRLG